MFESTEMYGSVEVSGCDESSVYSCVCLYGRKTNVLNLSKHG